MLSQKKGPDAVMVGVLCVALVLGLVGLALHVLWIVAIIVMASGSVLPLPTAAATVWML